MRPSAQRHRQPHRRPSSRPYRHYGHRSRRRRPKPRGQCCPTSWHPAPGRFVRPRRGMRRTEEAAARGPAWCWVAFFAPSLTKGWPVAVRANEISRRLLVPKTDEPEETNTRYAQNGKGDAEIVYEGGPLLMPPRMEWTKRDVPLGPTLICPAGTKFLAFGLWAGTGERKICPCCYVYNSDRSGDRMRRATQRWTLPRSYVEVTCREPYRSGLLWEPSLVGDGMSIPPGGGQRKE